MYFMEAARLTSRCDLCMALSHKTAQCALLGHNHPESQVSGPYMLESAPRVPQLLPTPGSGLSRHVPLGEICRLCNRNSCTFARCQHAHLCGVSGKSFGSCFPTHSMAARKGFRTTTFQQTVITRLVTTVTIISILLVIHMYHFVYANCTPPIMWAFL